jgi:hypothetical protein
VPARSIVTFRAANPWCLAYRKEIDTLVALAPVLLARHPPLQAFRIWCDRLAKFGRTKYGVADIVYAATSDQDIQETYRPMLGLSAS